LNNGYLDYFALSQAKNDSILLELDLDLDLDLDIVAISKASDAGVWFQMNQIEHKPSLHVKSGMVRAHGKSTGGAIFFFRESHTAG
jgi:hypothetical protein